MPCRAGKGFASADQPKRKRTKIDVEQLKADHGDKANAVQRVLQGRPALSPEDMMRARYSACRAKDAVFMGRTERDEMRPKAETRVRGWAVTFGLEERKEEDGQASEDSQALLHIQRLEVLAAKGLEVEFKMHCGEYGTLHERSIFKEDPKFGYIYTGDSIFNKWIK